MANSVVVFSSCSGRHRWVHYAAKDYDPSQVPAEWYCRALTSRHGWLHYMHDQPGNDKAWAENRPAWIQPHRENMTGTTKQYVPDNLPLFSAKYMKTHYNESEYTTWSPDSPSQPPDAESKKD